MTKTTSSQGKLKLSYLDGIRLKKAVVAAAQRVASTQERLNRINVFPVADRDTGTNMALTLKGAAEALHGNENIHLAQTSKLLADASLLSARGNSGVILAQFFQGMASSFAGCERVSLSEFAFAMRQAAAFAERAMAAPCEGTILTVMRDWADSLERKSALAPGFLEALQSSLDDAQASLQRTPFQLDALAKAKVVDAGAQGFVYMLEGIVCLLEGGETGWAEAAAPFQAIPAAVEDDTSFRYCTECIVQGIDLDLGRIKSMAGSLGNSVALAGDKVKIRIHVHTNDPDLLFTRAAEFGVVSQRKREDIQAQREASRNRRGITSIAVITDSSCDLPENYMRRHNIYVVPLKVTFGKTEYLDRVTITSDEIYEMMQRCPDPPKTSQATPVSFLQVYERVAESYSEAIAILVSGAGSGTFQSATVAARKQNSLKIEVVDSRTSSAALGFLVQTAVEAIDKGRSLAEVRRCVEEARLRTWIFFSISNLEHLVRTGRVGPTSSRIAKLLNLVPILSFSPTGKIVSVSKSRPRKASWTKLLDIAVKESTKLSQPRFQVCHSAEEEGARYVAGELARRLHVEPPEILKISPTMGAMVGPGVCVVAVTGAPEDQHCAD